MKACFCVSGVPGLHRLWTTASDHQGIFEQDTHSLLSGLTKGSHGGMLDNHMGDIAFFKRALLHWKSTTKGPLNKDLSPHNHSLKLLTDSLRTGYYESVEVQFSEYLSAFSAKLCFFAGAAFPIILRIKLSSEKKSKITSNQKKNKKMAEGIWMVMRALRIPRMFPQTINGWQIFQDEPSHTHCSNLFFS